MLPIPIAQVGALVNQYRFRLKAKCIGSVDVHHVLHSLFHSRCTLFVGRPREDTCMHSHTQPGRSARKGWTRVAPA